VTPTLYGERFVQAGRAAGVSPEGRASARSFARDTAPKKGKAMNINKLMKQAQKMQEQMSKAQAELEEKTVEVQAGGGKVTVVANGAGEVVSIKIAKEIVDPEDVEFLEEVVLSGVKQAIEQAKAIATSEMSKITGGMGVAGLGL
jgi:nucleoid-associated protein EbfC